MAIDIPLDVIERRYFRGIKNLIELYIAICDDWMVMNNMELESKIVAVKSKQLGETILNRDIWGIIINQSNDNRQ